MIMAKTENKKTFEDKMKRLDEIVAVMDTNELPLDETLKMYEEAQQLIKELEKELKEAKEKVAKYIE